MNTWATEHAPDPPRILYKRLLSKHARNVAKRRNPAKKVEACKLKDTS
jgi:hypothetical protein